MKFDPLVTYSEVLRDSVTVVLKGSDGRFYVSDVDKPGQWRSSTSSFAGAVEALNFTKEFWQEKMKPELRDSPRTARIDGVHYRIGEAHARGMRGFGGSRFLIQFNDGRRVKTNNLWCQGDIPRALRNDLPNNARFVQLPTNEAIEAWLDEGSIPHLDWGQDENNLPPAR